MNSQEKHSQNEKSKSLTAQAELLLDVLMEDMESNAATIRILLLIIELLETKEDPEDPG